MTDKDKLKKLLKEFGIGFDEYTGHRKEDSIALQINDDHPTKINNNYVAYIDFSFDKDGNFLELETSSD